MWECEKFTKKCVTFCYLTKLHKADSELIILLETFTGVFLIVPTQTQLCLIFLPPDFFKLCLIFFTFRFFPVGPHIFQPSDFFILNQFKG